MNLPALDDRPPGALVGYGRVSTAEQNLARQETALAAAGCIRSFFDKASGKKGTPRPGLDDLLDYVRPGDTVLVLSLDRLGRDLGDLIALVNEFERRDVAFTSIHEKIDTSSPAGVLIFHVFGALAQFLRALINSNRAEGQAAARAAGKHIGRPSKLTAEKLAYLVSLLQEPDRTLTYIAGQLGVSRVTLYKYLPHAIPGWNPGDPHVIPASAQTRPV